MNRIKGLKLAAGLGLGTIASLAIIAPVVTSLTQKTNTEVLTLKSNSNVKEAGYQNRIIFAQIRVQHEEIDGQQYSKWDGITILFLDPYVAKDMVNLHYSITETNLVGEMGDITFLYVNTNGISISMFIPVKDSIWALGDWYDYSGKLTFYFTEPSSGTQEVYASSGFNTVH